MSKILSINEVSELLNLSRQYLYTDRNQLGLKFIRIGKRKLGIPEESLNAWLEQRKENPGKPANEK